MLARVSLLCLSVVAASAAAQSAPPNAPKTISKADFTKNIDARFAAIDSNHDGSLSRSELAALQGKAVEKAEAVRQQKLEAEFKKLDTNKDGSLSLAEFKAAGGRPKAAESPDQMLAQLDSNKDGKVTAAEYRKNPLANFDKADANHDGMLTAQEIQQSRRH